MLAPSRPVAPPLRSPAVVAWCLYLFLIPFYVFRSGLPQPGDLMIFLLVPLTLAGWNGRLVPRFRSVLAALLKFTLWVIAVDVVWAIILRTTSVADLLFPVYYIYNALVFVCAFVLYQRHGDAFLRLTVHVVLASLAFQVLASFLMTLGWHSSSRSSLFFYNPNQLGYYALIAACLIATTYRHLQLGALRTSAAMSACAYLALLSASRSAVAGIGLLVVLLVMTNVRVIFIATIVAVGLTLAGGPVESSIDELQERVTTSRTPDLNFFEQRGYDRIWNNPEYVPLGAGEGASWRFAESTKIGGIEIHSTAGMLVFSYGLVGVVLFFGFMLALLRGARTRMALMLLPPLTYTFAHQGLRFTMLWVLLAAFVALKSAPVTAPTRRLAVAG